MQKVIFELNSKLGVKLTDRDFDMVHRLGQFSKTANRPVICKFVSRYHKQEVMGVRKKLKGSAMVIREDLTYQNVKLLESASGHEDVKSAWSDDGKIIVSFEGIKKKLVVNHTTDLKKTLLSKKFNFAGKETHLIIGNGPGKKIEIPLPLPGTTGSDSHTEDSHGIVD